MELLLNVLESQQRHLANEISNTDAFHAAELKNRERAFDRIVERVRGQLAPEQQNA
jgi:hypothetical protein